MTKPAHCCHERNEPCQYGWTDTHYHRCEPHNRPLSHEQNGDDQ
jgi:hypothetical protein